METLPQTREAAKGLGSKLYFTGVPCKHGHISPRRVDEGKCVACINERVNRRRRENPDHVRRLAAEWRRDNHEHVKAERRKSYHKHKDDILARARDRYATDPERRANVAVRRAAWKAANPERKKEADRLWVENNRKRHRERGRLWAQDNPDKVRAYAQKRYRADPDGHRERTKRWLAKNPHKIAEYCNAYRARAANAVGRFTADDIEILRKKQKGRCAACRKAAKRLAADHIIALSKGGTNLPSNIQLLCMSCNSRKHARDPIDFMQELGYLL